MQLTIQGASDRRFYISECFGTMWVSIKCRNQNWVPLCVHVLRVKSPILTFWSDVTKNKRGQSALANTPENIANSFVKGFGRRMLEHHKHSWNILKQAESYLTWQWRFESILWDRKMKKFLHCLWVIDIELPWCRKPCRWYPKSSFRLWAYGYMRTWAL